MQDSLEMLDELRKEVIETRNQAIKTDNQVKNLALDVKGFEKRFDRLERRTRLASVASMVIIAVVLAAAAGVVSSVHTQSVTKEAEEQLLSAQKTNDELQEQLTKTDSKLAEQENIQSDQRIFSEKLTQIFDALDAKKSSDAEKVLETLDFEKLPPLLKRLTKPRLDTLRKNASSEAFQSGRSLLRKSQYKQAIAELRRSLRFVSRGKESEPSRYLLATALWSSRRFDEAETELSLLLESPSTPQLADELGYLLATSYAYQGRKKEALTRFSKLMAAKSRYGSQIKRYVTALEAGTELPAHPQQSPKK